MKISNIGKPFLASCVLVVASYMVGCGGAEDRQIKYLEKAKAHFEEKNYDKARVETKNVLQINPKNVDARILMAKLERESGDYRAAFINFNSAAEEDPNNVESRVELGKIYFAGQQNDKAEENALKVLELDPQNKDGKVLLAGIEARKNNFSKAETLANEVLASHPNEASAIGVLASIYAQSDMDKSLNFLNEGLKSNPNDMMLQSIKLQVLIAKNDSDGAEKLLNEMVDNNPKRLDLAYQLARGYAALEKLDAAEAVLKKAVENNPDVLDAKIKLIEFYAQLKGYDAAHAALKQLMEEDPENIELTKAMAQLYVSHERAEEAKQLFRGIMEKQSEGEMAMMARTGLAKLLLIEDQRAEAEKIIAQVFSIEPNNTEALILNARIKLQDGKLNDAIADLRTALKSDDQSIEVLKLLATAEEGTGSPKLALDNYRRILSIDPNDMDALIAGGRLSLQDKDQEKAQLFLQRAVKLQPTNTTAVKLLLSLYIQQQAFDKTQPLIDPLMSNPQTKPVALVFQAGIARAQNDWETAKGYYEQILALEPRIYEAVTGMADYLMQKNDVAGAITFLENHTQKHPELDYAQELLGKAYFKAGKPTQAAKTLESLITKKPDRITAIQSLAGLYMSEQRRDDAEKLIRKGIENNPKNIQLPFLLASIFERENNAKETKSIYENILAIDPNNAAARNNLANVLVHHYPSDAGYAQALSLVEDLAKTNNPIYLDTIGWVHYHMGHTAQAISFLEAAIKLDDSVAEFHYHLGMAYHKNGQIDKAKLALTQATAGGESNIYPGKDQALATLETL